MDSKIKIDLEFLGILVAILIGGLLGMWLVNKYSPDNQYQPTKQIHIDSTRFETYSAIYSLSHTTTTNNILLDSVLLPVEKLKLVKRLDEKFKKDSIKFINRIK